MAEQDIHLPIISVIVPVYKTEKYLRRCVDSILAQTFTDFDLILVDDGSPDCCGTICDTYARQDPRVRVIHQPNGGLSAARNAGIDLMMRGDSPYLLFIDSDDWVHPMLLEVLLDAAKTHDARVCISMAAITEGEAPKVSLPVEAVKWKTDEYENINTAWGKLFRRDCFQTLRFPVGKLYEDAFIVYRIVCQDPEDVWVIHQPLYAYFQNPEGILRSPWSSRHLDALEAHHEQLEYFLENDYLSLADQDFNKLIRYNVYFKWEIWRCGNLSKSEKRRLVKKLDADLRHILIRYRRYGWLKPRDARWYIRVYSAFSRCCAESPGA